jgi:hypothetical protein
MSLLPRDEWMKYMTRLNKDMRALSQEWDVPERGPDACVVDDFIRSLLTEWAKRGRAGW